MGAHARAMEAGATRGGRNGGLVGWWLCRGDDEAGKVGAVGSRVGHPAEAGTSGVGRGIRRCGSVRFCRLRRPEIMDFDAGPMGPRRRLRRLTWELNPGRCYSPFPLGQHPKVSVRVILSFIKKKQF
jgi:hypothetical protein